MELRKYQNETVEDLEGHLAFDDLAVIPLPGGGGKSAIIAHMSKKAHEEQRHATVLTNLTALVPQLSKHLKEMKVPHSIVKAGSHSIKPGAYVTLIMEQSFHEKKRKELNIPCDVLIKDEMHIGIGQKRYEDIVKDLDPEQVIGTTFTPIDEAGYLMEGISPDNIVNTVSVKDLVEMGYLAPLRYFVPHWAEAQDYSEVASSGSDYNGKELEKIINTPEHTDLVIQSMNHRNARNRKTLVYAGSIDHADNLTAALKADGYKVGIVHSKCNSTDNEENIKRFLGEKVPLEATLENPKPGFKEDIDCIVSVLGLTVGFDAPATTLLVNIRPTKVLRLYLQILARAARPFEGKEYGEILDLAQGTQTHGFLDEPIRYIVKGDKKGLKDAKEARTAREVQVLVEEEPTQITRKMIIDKVEELERNAHRIPELPVKDLVAIYDTTNRIEQVAEIAYEMNRRKTGQRYTQDSIKWMLEDWYVLLEEQPLYRSRILKMAKTMFKKKVSEGKKIAAMKYTPEWIRTITPFSYAYEDNAKDSTEYANIEDSDIPF